MPDKAEISISIPRIENDNSDKIKSDEPLRSARLAHSIYKLINCAELYRILCGRQYTRHQVHNLISYEIVSLKKFIEVERSVQSTKFTKGCEILHQI